MLLDCPAPGSILQTQRSTQTVVTRTAKGQNPIDVHPAQMVDFVAGFFGADICRDDFAHTRGPKLKGSDREILIELGRIQSARKSLDAYRQEKDVNSPAE